jgi:hypothetical protein
MRADVASNIASRRTNASLRRSASSRKRRSATRSSNVRIKRLGMFGAFCAEASKICLEGSADFQVCCIAGFQTRVPNEPSDVLKLRTRCRFGNRRYSRFGNLRYINLLFTCPLWRLLSLNKVLQSFQARFQLRVLLVFAFQFVADFSGLGESRSTPLCPKPTEHGVEKTLSPGERR